MSRDKTELSPNEALEALNALRSNIVGTQRASWSNVAYPLVAILNAAGLEQFDPSEEQLRQHMDCYGGAGGYPGHELSEPDAGWCEPVGRLQLISEAARWFLDDPSEKNRGYLEARLEGLPPGTLTSKVAPPWPGAGADERDYSPETP